MRSVELFAGTGGLALGLARAGFSRSLVADWDKHACATLRENAKWVPEMADWEVVEADVRSLDYSPHQGSITLLAAGAPCQPFSLGGKHRGDEDDRNMFPEVFRAAQELRPDAILLENVKGLLRESFRPYFDYILLRLSLPERLPAGGEGWREHKARLEREVRLAPARDELRYELRHELVDVADFGVPQNRHRVLVVAFRSDLGQAPQLTRTHSADALLWAQYVDGSYWREHELEPRDPPIRFASRVNVLAMSDRPWQCRWRTVRDALRGLPPPVDHEEDIVFPNHSGIPGARSYNGHSGSLWDRPAKTIKAGVHGVPGGENMLLDEDGNVRYFTVRETARLQTFPDVYRFSGPWGECMRQLGNAVPVKIGEEVGGMLLQGLRAVQERQQSKSSDSRRVMAPQQVIWNAS